MSEQSAEKVAEPARFERTLRIDPKFAGRMTSGTFRYVALVPGRIVRVAISSVAVATVFSFTLHPAGATSIWVAVLGLLAIPALYLLIFFISYFPARRQIGGRFPVGSEYSIAIGDDAMRLKDPLVTTEVSYQLYRSLRVSAKLVAFIPRRGSRPTLLPAELFTPESLEWLRSKLIGLA